MDINRKINNDDNKNSYKIMGYSTGSYPSRTIIYHVAFKGVQVGSIVGLFVVTPILKGYKKMAFLKAWRYAMTLTPIGGGLFASSYLCILNYQGKLTIDAVDDRASRILKNNGQLLSLIHI